MNKRYKTFQEAVKNTKKGDLILFDELEDKIIINPSKFDFMRAFSHTRNFLKNGKNNNNNRQGNI